MSGAGAFPLARSKLAKVTSRDSERRPRGNIGYGMPVSSHFRSASGSGLGSPKPDFVGSTPTWPVMSKKRKKLKLLLGRDPTCGRVTFKSGVILTRKDRLKNRNDKYARKERRDSIIED